MANAGRDLPERQLYICLDYDGCGSVMYNGTEEQKHEFKEFIKGLVSKDE